MKDSYNRSKYYDKTLEDTKRSISFNVHRDILNRYKEFINSNWLLSSQSVLRENLDELRLSNFKLQDITTSTCSLKIPCPKSTFSLYLTEVQDSKIVAFCNLFNLKKHEFIEHLIIYIIENKSFDLTFKSSDIYKAYSPYLCDYCEKRLVDDNTIKYISVMFIENPIKYEEVLNSSCGCSDYKKYKIYYADNKYRIRADVSSLKK